MDCSDICRFAQHCNRQGSATDPEKCAMYYKLEDYWWDAECSKGDYEDRDREEAYEDDGDEEAV